MSSGSSYPHRVSFLLLMFMSGNILGVRFKILVLLQYTKWLALLSLWHSGVQVKAFHKSPPTV